MVPGEGIRGMTKEQTIAIMSAAIYSVRVVNNPERHRLDTLRRDCVEEAQLLFDEVRGEDSE